MKDALEEKKAAEAERPVRIQVIQWKHDSSVTWDSDNIVDWKKLMDFRDMHEAESSGFGAWLDLRVEGKSEVLDDSILKFLSHSPENPVRFVGFGIRKSTVHWKHIHNAMLKNKIASNLYLLCHKGYQETPVNILHLTFTMYC